MIVNVTGKLITLRVYRKKDKETKLETDEKSVTDVAVLVSETNDYALSGEVIKPYISKNFEYVGPFDFSSYKRYELISLTVDVGVNFDGKQVYSLINIQKLENKK